MHAFCKKSLNTAKQVKSNCTKWGSCKAVHFLTAGSCVVFCKGGIKSQTTLRNLQIQSTKYSKACKPKFKKSLAKIYKLSYSTNQYCVKLYNSACINTASPADACGLCTLTCGCWTKRNQCEYGIPIVLFKAIVCRVYIFDVQAEFLKVTQPVRNISITTL